MWRGVVVCSGGGSGVFRGGSGVFRGGGVVVCSGRGG